MVAFEETKIKSKVRRARREASWTAKGLRDMAASRLAIVMGKCACSQLRHWRSHGRAGSPASFAFFSKTVVQTLFHIRVSALVRLEGNL